MPNPSLHQRLALFYRKELQSAIAAIDAAEKELAAKEEVEKRARKGLRDATLAREQAFRNRQRAVKVKKWILEKMFYSPTPSLETGDELQSPTIRSPSANTCVEPLRSPVIINR